MPLWRKVSICINRLSCWFQSVAILNGGEGPYRISPRALNGPRGRTVSKLPVWRPYRLKPKRYRSLPGRDRRTNEAWTSWQSRSCGTRSWKTRKSLQRRTSGLPAGVAAGLSTLLTMLWSTCGTNGRSAMGTGRRSRNQRQVSPRSPCVSRGCSPRRWCAWRTGRGSPRRLSSGPTNAPADGRSPPERRHTEKFTCYTWWPLQVRRRTSSWMGGAGRGKTGWHHHPPPSGAGVLWDVCGRRTGASQIPPYASIIGQWDEFSWFS